MSSAVIGGRGEAGGGVAGPLGRVAAGVAAGAVGVGFCELRESCEAQSGFTSYRRLGLPGPSGAVVTLRM